MSVPAHPLRSFQQFLTKNSLASCPTLPIHPILPRVIFWGFFVVVSPIKKVLKGKHFADVEEVKQKTVDALKGINVNKLKNFLEQWKKLSIGELNQMERTLKVTEV